jgi:4-hydroxy-3-methylbut-2-enyl diphosphate reductase
MEVLDWLAARGFGEVAEVTTAQEKLTFALPHELRRDIKAAASERSADAAALAASVSEQASVSGSASDSESVPVSKPATPTED